MAQGYFIAVCRLQFGHGCDAVETLRKCWEGNSSLALQFGHGCDAVETGRANERDGR